MKFEIEVIGIPKSWQGENMKQVSFLDEIIAKYDEMLIMQAEECNPLLERFCSFLDCTQAELEALSSSVSALADTLKIVVGLAAEKERQAKA